VASGPQAPGLTFSAGRVQDPSRLTVPHTQSF